jgi:uncharacterized LabA/DUF88 family protein
MTSCPRVMAFVDGFNLYHGIDDTGRNDLKWLDIRTLCEHLANKCGGHLISTTYFTAYRYSKKVTDPVKQASLSRHRAYVAALESRGVRTVHGYFAVNGRKTEEKETDVNIALWMLRGALQQTYDHALLISADSDLAPAIRMIRQEQPHTGMTVAFPPNRKSTRLRNSLRGWGNCTDISVALVEQSLLPKDVYSSSGRLVTSRPHRYLPPR